MFDDDDYDVDDPEEDDDPESESPHNVEEDEPENEAHEEDGSTTDNQDNSHPTFVGNGFDCTCSGKCLCRYYAPKGTYDTDCAYCGHGLHWHRRR